MAWRKQDPGLAAAIAEATRARGCPACGNTYVGAAFQIHRDGGRCLPGDAYGQLVKVDGAWSTRGSDTARQ